MKKKLVVLSLVLSGLIILAGVLFYFSRRQTRIPSPLEGLDAAKVSKIVIKSGGPESVIERVDGRWRMTAPVQDRADDTVVDGLVETLSGFALGPVVSENKEKLAGFDLGTPAAIIVQAYVAGEEKPALDIEVGKMAQGYRQTYARLRGRDEVRIANDLPRFYLQKTPKDLRLQHLLPVDIEKATSVSVEVGRQSLTFSRSSDTWSLAGGAAPVDKAWMDSLLTKMKDLYINDFAASDAGPASTGLQKPFMKLTVATAGESASAAVGSTLPPNDPRDPRRYYARTDGRDALLIMAGDLINDLAAHLSSRR